MSSLAVVHRFFTCILKHTFGILAFKKVDDVDATEHVLSKKEFKKALQPAEEFLYGNFLEVSASEIALFALPFSFLSSSASSFSRISGSSSFITKLAFAS